MDQKVIKIPRFCQRSQCIKGTFFVVNLKESIILSSSYHLAYIGMGRGDRAFDFSVSVSLSLLTEKIIDPKAKSRHAIVHICPYVMTKWQSSHRGGGDEDCLSQGEMGMRYSI